MSRLRVSSVLTAANKAIESSTRAQYQCKLTGIDASQHDTDAESQHNTHTHTMAAAAYLPLFSLASISGPDTLTFSDGFAYTFQNPINLSNAQAVEHNAHL